MMIFGIIAAIAAAVAVIWLATQFWAWVAWLNSCVDDSFDERD